MSKLHSHPVPDPTPEQVDRLVQAWLDGLSVTKICLRSDTRWPPDKVGAAIRSRLGVARLTAKVRDDILMAKHRKTEP